MDSVGTVVAFLEEGKKPDRSPSYGWEEGAKRFPMLKENEGGISSKLEASANSSS